MTSVVGANICQIGKIREKSFILHPGNLIRLSDLHNLLNQAAQFIHRNFPAILFPHHISLKAHFCRSGKKQRKRLSASVEGSIDFPARSIAFFSAWLSWRQSNFIVFFLVLESARLAAGIIWKRTEGASRTQWSSFMFPANRVISRKE
ncbi:hypothetical protein [Propionivibrio sp.]|uniref:hypothetical protein n=1 Tax=Propionivibrio sp. TaxID=2212460 RepID=UPI003BF2ABDC